MSRNLFFSLNQPLENLEVLYFFCKKVLQTAPRPIMSPNQWSQGKLRLLCHISQTVWGNVGIVCEEQ
jgi:hypothetical protein